MSRLGELRGSLVTHKSDGVGVELRLVRGKPIEVHNVLRGYPVADSLGTWRGSFDGCLLAERMLDGTYEACDVCVSSWGDQRRVPLGLRLHVVGVVCAQLGPRVRAKAFYPAECACRVWSENQLKACDGVIFLPQYGGVPLKWKPRNLLSVDCSVKLLDGSDGTYGLYDGDGRLVRVSRVGGMSLRRGPCVVELLLGGRLSSGAKYVRDRPDKRMGNRGHVVSCCMRAYDEDLRLEDVVKFLGARPPVSGPAFGRHLAARRAGISVHLREP